MSKALTCCIYEIQADQASYLGMVLRETAASKDLPFEKITVCMRLDEVDVSADIFLIGFSTNRTEGLKFAADLRCQNESARIIFLVSTALEAQLCVRPDTRPDGILVRPPTVRQLARLAIELCAAYARSDEAHHDQHCLKVKSGTVLRRLYFHDICFFEAREKKVAVKTLAQEIVYYDNLSELESRLPDYFLRCHKGFIVNTRKIKEIDYQTMTLHLDDGCKIPLSRSRKLQMQDHFIEQRR